MLLATVHATAHATPDPSTGAGAVIGGMLFFVGCAALCGFIAKKKGRNPLGWIVAGLLFNFLAVLAVLIVGRNSNLPLLVLSDEERTRLLSGDIQPIQADGIVAEPGEIFYYSAPAKHGAFHKSVEWGGASVSIPVGHTGMRVRPFSGRAASEQQFQWDAIGTVYVSNHRLLMVGETGYSTLPYGSIVRYETLPTGLRLLVKDVGVQAFQTGNAALGIVFSRFMNARAEPKT